MSASKKHAQLSQATTKSNACHTNGGESGVLYVVATPIGNLADMTFRAVETLKQVDVVACEDTRVSRKLTSHYGIQTPLQSYHEHNAHAKNESLIQLLLDGKSIALISDAGTPVISDPGHSLIQQAHTANITVTPIPGACAAISAVSVAALGSGDFYMAGFLPAKGKPRKEALGKLHEIPSSIVLYEAPHRLQKTLSDLMQSLGDRNAMIAREITKLHETFYRGKLSELITQFEGQKPKGEIVMMLDAPAKGLATPSIDSEEVADLLKQALSSLPAAKAAAHVAQITGLNKKTLYAKANELKAD